MYLVAADAPSPNALLPCGTYDARRRHTIKAERCRDCWPSSNGLPPMPACTRGPVRHLWKGER